MSSETDQPRQRTVAELLAQHGDVSATGRRRRRREPDEPDEAESPAPAALPADPPDWRAAPEPDFRPRSETPAPPRQEPGGRRRAGGDASWDADPPAADPREADGFDAAPWASAQQTQSAGRRDPGWDADQYGADQYGADRYGSDQYRSDQPVADEHAADRFDAAGPWDADPRAAARDRQPEPPSWNGAAAPAEYPGPPPRSRAQRREAEEREEPPARSWDQPPPVAEPRAVREAPSWAAQEPEPMPNNGRTTRFRGTPREIPDPAADPSAADLADQPPAWDAEPPRRRSAAAAPVDRSPGRQPERAVGQSLEQPEPTEQMPLVRRRAAATDDPGRTTRFQSRRRAEPDDVDPDEDDGGPSTMVGGAPAGAEAWHQDRTGGRRRRPEADADYDDPEDDDGPATMVGSAPSGAETWHRARTDGRRPDDGSGPPTQAAAPLAFDDDDEDDEDGRDYPAGLGRRDLDDDERTGFFAPEDDDPEPEDSEKRSPAWAAVIGQWIAGAVGGAALWVGFRFLWRDLPVVALAAAVLATVGLVVVVRALLRSNDLRTTLFAVLVGLLLTVSPAILVLLGR